MPYIVHSKICQPAPSHALVPCFAFPKEIRARPSISRCQDSRARSRHGEREAGKEMRGSGTHGRIFLVLDDEGAGFVLERHPPRLNQGLDDRTSCNTRSAAAFPPHLQCGAPSAHFCVGTHTGSFRRKWHHAAKRCLGSAVSLLTGSSCRGVCLGNLRRLLLWQRLQPRHRCIQKTRFWPGQTSLQRTREFVCQWQTGQLRRPQPTR